MSQLLAVFFDLGDTLVDLGEGRGDYEARVQLRAARVYDALVARGCALGDRAAFAAALAHDSEALYQAALAEQRGIDVFDVLRAFLPAWGVTGDDGLLQAAADAFYQRTGPPTPLRSGAREVLEELRARGLRLGVISNTLQPRRYMDGALAHRGIAHFFEATIYSSEERVAKPHPAIFRAALAALRVPAHRSVYVGDRLETDVAGAQGVGMRAVLVEAAHRTYARPDIVPDARVRELPELLDVLPALDG